MGEGATKAVPEQPLVNDEILRRFDTIVKELKNDFVLVGDCLLVEVLPKREIKVSEHIHFAGTPGNQRTGMESNPPIFVRVLVTGCGYYNEETGETTELEVVPGNVLEVAANCVRWFSQFGSLQVRGIDGNRHLCGIGLCREADHHIKFTDYSAYDRFMRHFEIA